VKRTEDHGKKKNGLTQQETFSLKNGVNQNSGLTHNFVMIPAGLANNKITELHGRAVMPQEELANNQKPVAFSLKTQMHLMATAGVTWTKISKETATGTALNVGIVINVLTAQPIVNGLLILGMMIMAGVTEKT